MYKADRCNCQCQKYAMAEVPMQQWGDHLSGSGPGILGISKYALYTKKLQYQAGSTDDGDQSDQFCTERSHTLS